MKQSNTLYNRLVGAFIYTTCIVSLLYGVLVYNAMKYTEDDILGRRVETEAQHYIEQYRINKQLAKLPHSRELYGYLSSSPDLPEWLASQPQGTRELHDREVHIAVTDLPDKSGLLYIVLSELDSSSLESQRSALFFVLFAVGIIITLTGMVIGVILGRYITQPIHKLTEDISASGAGNIHSKPLPFYGAERSDEVGALSRSFTQLVRRLSEFIEREKSFTRHASHELRTPITVIKNALAVINLEDTSTESKGRNIQRIAQANQEMADLVDSFLYLGRERPVLVREPVELHRILSDCLEKYNYLNSEKALVIRKNIEAQVNVYNDEKLIKVLIDNIIRNMFLHGYSKAEIGLSNQTLLVSNDVAPSVGHEPANEKTFGLQIIERIAQHCDLTVQVKSTAESFSVKVSF